MVHFVGAGPGAVDLITIRGKRLLEQADIIIYAGSLVNPGLLEYAAKECEIHNSALMTLEEVLAVMRKGFLEDKDIVRLHTGDPSLYGAVREQMDRLVRWGIPYEVCPGVSSFGAAAASLGCEYTLPGVSQSVIITRAEGRTPVPAKEKLTKLGAHGVTMVLFLSAAMLEQVQEQLCGSGGYTKDTPCALCYKVSWEDERIIRGSLGRLAQMVEENRITKTALVVVGDVLGDDYELSRLYASDFSTQYRRAGK